MKLDGSELRIAVSAYEAATDPSKWKDVLTALALRCDATKAALFTPVEGAKERFLWCDIGFDPRLLEVYSSHWVKEDAWIATHEEQRLYSAGSVRIGSSYLPWDGLERTAFYNEFAAPAGVKALVSLVLCDAPSRSETKPLRGGSFPIAQTSAIMTRRESRQKKSGLYPTTGET